MEKKQVIDQIVTLLNKYETDTNEVAAFEAHTRCQQMGALWNLLFPDERNDWDYPNQMYRLVFDRVKWLLDLIEILGNEDLVAAAHTVASKSPHCDPGTYEWSKGE